MSWQRIDENTYIDDTLVTCAEYQLFIDEMREQGKYYQPDHWISYQFQTGQAREPILGVRYSDVVAFSSWMLKRESREWLYRSPTATEAAKFPIYNVGLLPIGYWIRDENDRAQIAWIGSLSNDTRALDIDLAFERIRDIEFNLSRARDLGRIHNFASVIDHIHNLARTLDLRSGQTSDRILELDHACDLALDLELSLSRDFRLVGNEAHELFGASNIVHHLSVDISTLRERIAGRSPAFEGIRLVKERK